MSSIKLIFCIAGGILLAGFVTFSVFSVGSVIFAASAFSYYEHYVKPSIDSFAKSKPIQTLQPVNFGYSGYTNNNSSAVQVLQNTLTTT